MVDLVVEIKERIVRAFLDVAILCVLDAHNELNGNRVRQLLNEKLSVILSPGSIYPALYALERKQLVERIKKGRAQVFRVTAEGSVKLKDAKQIPDTVHGVMKQLCRINE
jgi:DNA-binding PadR family transcriptional regulator